ncbi:MAG: DUF2007 domain-containing protein [Candidatus Aminicenantes bacterium]|nr:DUF2007 domain-containing protein [Candidatus Aminicenantes bacterium]MDH5715663.1 DUF2007 domain-containing protein [Candidatus Aminicenantes bacterium]
MEQKGVKFKHLSSAMGRAEAEVIKGFLESNGIECIFQSQVVHSVHPFTVNGLGEVKIMVKEEDFERAKRLMEEKSPGSTDV